MPAAAVKPYPLTLKQHPKLRINLKNQYLDKSTFTNTSIRPFAQHCCIFSTQLGMYSVRHRNHSNSIAGGFAALSAFRQPKTLRAWVADVGVDGVDGSHGVFAQCGLGTGDVFGQLGEVGGADDIAGYKCLLVYKGQR